MKMIRQCLYALALVALPYCGLAANGPGNALDFTASGSVAVVTNASGPLPGVMGQITIEFWANVLGELPSSAAVFVPDEINNRCNICLPWTDGRIYWDFGNTTSGGRLSYQPPQAFYTGGWQHFAFVADSVANRMAIYRNGKLEAAKAGVSSWSTGFKDLWLGRLPSAGSFAGQMDEFRLWTVARSDAEIGRDYNVRLTGTEPSLYLCFHCDETGGTWITNAGAFNANASGGQGFLGGPVARVASGAGVGLPLVTSQSETASGLVGTFSGTIKPDGTPTQWWFVYGTNTSPVQTFSNLLAEQTVTFSVTNLLPGPYVVQLFAANGNGTNSALADWFTMPNPAAQNAFYFPPNHDGYVVFGNNTSLPFTNQVFTVEAWVSPQANPGSYTDQPIIAWGADQPNDYNYFALTPTGFRHSWGGGNELASTTPDLGNAWHHVAVTWDGAVRTLYLDGLQAASAAPSQTPNVSQGGVFLLGAGFDPAGPPFGMNYFLGTLDEVRVWGLARSGNEIAATRHSRLSGQEAGLVAYYPMDQPNPFLDASGHTNDIISYQEAVVASTAPLNAPLVTLLPASPILGTGATLNGTVHTLGYPTVVHFEYGPTPALGMSTTNLSLPGVYAAFSVALPLTGLEPGTPYYYRLVAGNSVGTSASATQSLHTLLLGYGWPVSTKVESGGGSSPTVAVDGAGNTLVGGQISGPATFGSAALVPSGTPTNAFVGLLSPAGDWRWARGISNAWAQIASVKADGLGNCYVAGNYLGTPVLGVGLSLPPAASPAGFAGKLTSAGTWVWAVPVSAAASACAVNDMAIGAGGELYLAGEFAGSVGFTNLAGGALTLGSSSYQNGFVARLESSGQWTWATNVSGVGGSRALLVAAGAASGTPALWVSGQFDSTASLGGQSLTSAGGKDLFLARLDPASGAWNLGKRGGGASDDWPTAIASAANGDVFLAAHVVDAGDYDGSVSLPGLGDATHILHFTSTAALQWYADAPGGNVAGLAVGQDGALYVSGDFENSLVLAGGFGLNALARDVFLARIDMTSGQFTWAQRIGSQGGDTAGGMVVDPTGTMVTVGTFQLTMQVGYVNLAATAARDIFVARFDTGGVFEHNRWTVGQAVPIPVEALDSSSPKGAGTYSPPNITILSKVYPDSTAANSFVWSLYERKLYAVRPVTAQIDWPRTSNLTNLAAVVKVVGTLHWPTNLQKIVANSPTRLEPQLPSLNYRLVQQSFDAANSTLDLNSHTFTTHTNGYAVLQFLQTGGALPDVTRQSSVFEVLQSVAYNDPSVRSLVAAEVGQTLRRATHGDPEGRNGFVYFYYSPYDGVGGDRAYDRPTRMGPIIPVNQNARFNPPNVGGTVIPDSNNANADPMVVVWYHTNTVTGVAWPDDPVQYALSWPAPNATNTIVIASGLGSGYLDPVYYSNLRLYNQPDAGQPGFNPNEEHALVVNNTAYALRNDLNDTLGGFSQPYVLAKYTDPNLGEWAIRAFFVTNATPQFPFVYPGEAGNEIQPPMPLSVLPLCTSSNRYISGPGYQDYTGKLYARAAGDGNNPTNIMAHWFYPMQADFYPNTTGNPGQTNAPGDCVPWLDHLAGGQRGVPVDVTYQISWPQNVPVLHSGDVLAGTKNGLPDIYHFASARIVYDQSDPQGTVTNSRVRLFDPVGDRALVIATTGAITPVDTRLPNAQLMSPLSLAESDILALATQILPGGLRAFPDLPYHLRQRFIYDPNRKALIFRGLVDPSVNFGGPSDPLVLPNVMTFTDEQLIARLLQSKAPAAFSNYILKLMYLTWNPNKTLANFTFGIQATYGANGYNYNWENLGAGPKALSARLAVGGAYVTIAENDDPALAGLPVTLHVIRVGDGIETGDLKVIPPDNVFDERLTLRHSGFFPQDLDSTVFEWYYHPADVGFNPQNLPVFNATGTNLNNWLLYKSAAGLNDVTLGTGGESSLLVMSDNYFVCRFIAPDWANFPPGQDASGVAGAPGGGEAQLAEGYVKRVIFGLNPFAARTQDFHNSPAATYSSMLREAGRRYEGDIAFNPDADNLNKVGLIEAYQTVLRHARNLSVNGTPPVNYGPANDALLLAAGSVSDLYMLLGNEAYADACDPTIGFRTDGTGYGSLAPSIFCFQDQVNSLLEEELCLLRGRDDSSASVRTAPVYNRLFWNFTHGEGEVAYAQNYNVTDQNGDGFINADDAAIMYPQGHGDAWGHYLTSITTYYDLLRNTNFTWIPRTEEILLAGQPVEVNYQDERKFAVAASARAKTGSDIVDLTYRLNYVDDPAGQFQGYKDTQTNRSWGVDEWARRAAGGAYLDWVMANAILPALDPDPTHSGIQRVDRTTVLELADIPAAFTTIQDQVDKADKGLNPLGVAKNAVPFDIDPSAVSSGQTHFEQIYGRALNAVNNAVAAWNNANQLTTALRSTADSQTAFSHTVDDQERDYKNRLLEIFGYPYSGDIGAGGTYPAGYDGADLYHWMYLDTPSDTGSLAPQNAAVTGYYTKLSGLTSDAGHYFTDFGAKPYSLAANDNTNLDISGILPVSYPLAMATAGGFAFSAPSAWGARQAPGEIQFALNEFLQSQAKLKQSLLNYNALLAKIDDGIANLQAAQKLSQDTAKLRQQRDAAVITLKLAKSAFSMLADNLKDDSGESDKLADALIEALPKVVGVANDVTSPARGAIKAASAAADGGFNAGELLANIGKEAADNGADIAKDQFDEQVETLKDDAATAKELREVEETLREEAPARLEVIQAAEVVEQNLGKFKAAVAKGQQVIQDRVTFRQRAAAQTQTARYQDMTFRIFRNDALQKYRATFDLAARYVFLAANAYDFETQLLGGSTGSGREFLTDIVRQRSLGQMLNGIPVAGIRGLADPLGRLGQNFAVLKGQLGFNNPQTETGRFSLRRELFRIRDNDSASWQTVLNQHRVPNLWDLPEFRRFCRAFAPETAGPQPGIVIRFPTTVTFGLNYFGWPLGGGDNSYDPTVFATKIRSAGVWFQNYLGSGLSVTPRVYLVPVGAEVLRSPSGTGLDIRMWRVVDQKIPVPFPIGASSFSDPAWIPIDNSLSDTFGGIRQFSSFRAYHDSGTFTDAETVSDSRLIGRSVWNTDWMLIIPGGTFLYDPNQGLDTFIGSCSDIKIFFQTYGYSGD